MLRTSRALMLLLLPLAVLAVFGYGPIIAAFSLGVMETDGLGASTFVGLAHYAAMLGDERLIRSAQVMGLILGATVLINVSMPLVAAKLIAEVSGTRLQYAYRVLFVIPMLIPVVVVLLIWRELYASDGAINALVSLLGMGGWTRTWLGDPTTALLAIIGVNFPWISGAGLLIYLAGFSAVPTQLREAAVLDGAGSVRVFWSVELPMLRGQVGVVAVLAMLSAVQGYENILILTQGGPADATLVPGLHMFENAFRFGKLGYASAVGTVLFVVCAALSAISMRLTRSNA